jgi:hypothetical protein
MIFSEAYQKTIKKLIPKTYTFITTDKAYTDYVDSDDYIFIYGNAMNEKMGAVQIRTSTNKVNHYNSKLIKLLKYIQELEGLMDRLF